MMAVSVFGVLLIFFQKACVKQASVEPIFVIQTLIEEVEAYLQ